MALQRVGYWGGEFWPDPEELVDETWAGNDREIVIDYLRHGFIARACLGRAECRLCGIQLGNLDLSDGSYIWPERLDHYLSIHHVRLPEWFVAHVLSVQGKLEEEKVSDSLWSTVKVGRQSPRRR